MMRVADLQMIITIYRLAINLPRLPFVGQNIARFRRLLNTYSPLLWVERLSFFMDSDRKCRSHVRSSQIGVAFWWRYTYNSRLLQRIDLVLDFPVLIAFWFWFCHFGGTELILCCSYCLTRLVALLSLLALLMEGDIALGSCMLFSTCKATHFQK